LYAFTDTDPKTVAATLTFLVGADDGVVYLAEHDNAVVGLLGAVIYPLFFNANFRLAVELGFFVEKAYRACGYGVGLQERFEAWARSRGANAALMCAPANATSLREVYEKYGYSYLESQFIKGLT
jgi:GNAT superfamily N-acetyltransferase